MNIFLKSIALFFVILYPSSWIVFIYLIYNAPKEDKEQLGLLRFRDKIIVALIIVIFGPFMLIFSPIWALIKGGVKGESRT